MPRGGPCKWVAESDEGQGPGPSGVVGFPLACCAHSGLILGRWSGVGCSGVGPLWHQAPCTANPPFCSKPWALGPAESGQDLCTQSHPHSLSASSFRVSWAEAALTWPGPEAQALPLALAKQCRSRAGWRLGWRTCSPCQKQTHCSCPSSLGILMP